MEESYNINQNIKNIPYQNQNHIQNNAQINYIDNLNTGGGPNQDIHTKFKEFESNLTSLKQENQELKHSLQTNKKEKEPKNVTFDTKIKNRSMFRYCFVSINTF